MAEVLAVLSAAIKVAQAVRFTVAALKGTDDHLSNLINSNF